MRRFRLMVALAAASMVSGVASAAPQYFSSVGAYGGNYLSPSNIGSALLPGDSSVGNTGNNALATNAGAYTASGLDGAGNNASMTLNYSGSAQAGTQGLKAVASANLSDAFYNPSNPRYVVDSDLNTDPTGVPDNLFVESRAEVRDALSVAGGSDLSYITASLRFHGQTFNGLDVAGWRGGVSGQVYDAAGQLHAPDSPPGLTVYDSLITTRGYAVTGGTTDFVLWLWTYVNFIFNEDYSIPGIEPYYEGTADFFNTVTIESFSGFDANGRAVDLFSVEGSDGYAYQTVRVDDPQGPGNEVPEPATVALLGVGLFSMVVSRRLKSRSL